MSQAKHRYAVGEIVDYRPGFAAGAGAQGAYEVVRQLPAENAVNQYHIKSTRDGHQRVVREDQLRPSDLQRARTMFAKA
jgi:hypothetical protein